MARSSAITAVISGAFVLSALVACSNPTAPAATASTAQHSSALFDRGPGARGEPEPGDQRHEAEPGDQRHEAEPNDPRHEPEPGDLHRGRGRDDAPGHH